MFELDHLSTLHLNQCNSPTGIEYPASNIFLDAICKVFACMYSYAAFGSLLVLSWSCDHFR